MKKLLLIHGWNYTNYTSSKCLNAWANRMHFVDELKQHFNVVMINLPGFCSTPDPKEVWNLDNFVRYIDAIIQKEQPEYLLGYSFGGAVALRWKYLTKDLTVKTFLVSPAIVRQYVEGTPSSVQVFLKKLLPKKVMLYVRNFYLAHIQYNPYYTSATPTMRETYRQIVTVDLRKELKEVKDSLVLIYGNEDTATPPDFVAPLIAGSVHVFEGIQDGGHDIANTHTKELVKTIVKYS